MTTDLSVREARPGYRPGDFSHPCRVTDGRRRKHDSTKYSVRLCGTECLKRAISRDINPRSRYVYSSVDQPDQSPTAPLRIPAMQFFAKLVAAFTLLVAVQAVPAPAPNDGMSLQGPCGTVIMRCDY